MQVYELTKSYMRQKHFQTIVEIPLLGRKRVLLIELHIYFHFSIVVKHICADFFSICSVKQSYKEKL